MSIREIIPPPKDHRDFYKPSPKVIIVITVLIWASISLFNTGIFVFSYEEEGPVYEFFHGLRWTPLYHSPWLLITPFIFYTARVFPLNKTITFKNVSIHIALALLIAFITSVLHSGFIYIRLGEAFQLRTSPTNFLFYSVDRVMIYFAILLGYYGVDYYKKKNRESIKELKLRESISRQNLNGFKKEIHPDFLMNTIGEIHDTLPLKPGKAETMIADFAQVVRTMLHHSQKPIVHSDEDFRFLETYVNLLEARIEQQIDIYNAGSDLTHSNNLAISNHLIRFIEALLTENKQALQNLKSIQYKAFETEQSYGKRVKLSGFGAAGSNKNETGNSGNGPALNCDAIKTETISYTEDDDLILMITSPKHQT